MFGYDLLSFEGRMNRKPYILIGLTLMILSSFIMKYAGTGYFSTVLGILFTLIGISFHVRRCHDLDKSAWWCLLLLLPLINTIFIIYLLCAKGTSGTNSYGPDPLG